MMSEKKQIWEKDTKEPRGFLIGGTGKGAIDLFKLPRESVLVSVFANPTGRVWPTQTVFKNMNQVWAVARGFGFGGYSKTKTAEFKRDGQTILDCGAIVTKLQDGRIGVDWPKETHLVAPNSKQDIASALVAGVKEVFPNVASAQAIVHLWGGSISLDGMYRLFRDGKAYEVCDAEGAVMVRMEFVGIWRAGRVETIGKPSKHQQRMRLATEILDKQAKAAQEQVAAMAALK
jgi:hypothetical protein